MKNLTLLLCLITFSLLFAQKKDKLTVTGKVIETSTKQPLEYATLVLTNTKNKQILGGVTNTKGNFSIKAPIGLYNMKVEFMGFKTTVLPQKKITKNTNLGVISLSQDAQSLDEIEIISEKSTVEIKLDKKIYNVGKDMTVKGGTASDVLDNVPSVTVDSDGTVSLRGNENVRILIDGKPSALVGLSGAEALRNLPADAIKKVEVVTSPSARYDAEGTAGILNIILRKGKIRGFNGSVSVSAGIPESYRFSTNLNYRTKKANLFSNIGLAHKKPIGTSNFLTKNYNNNNNNNNNVIESYLKQNRDNDRKKKNYTPSFGMEYYINDKSSITGQFTYSKSISDNTNTNSSYYYNATNSLISESIRVQNEDNNENTQQYSLNYSNNIDTDGQKLNTDIQYSTSLEKELIDIFSNEIYTEKNSQFTNAKIFLFQVDYVLPIGEGGQFELGHKTDLKDVNSDFKVRKGDGTTPLYDPSNEINFYQIIYAFYAQYGKKTNNFSYLFGLRAEQTNFELELLNNNEISKKKYLEWFPTANIGYELNEKSTITIGYSRRLKRPRRWFLNPFESRTSNTFVFKGNPDLNPSYTNAFELGYSTKVKKVFLNSSAYYKKSTQNTQVLSRIEDRPDVNNNSITTEVHQPYNISGESRYGFEFNTSFKPAKWISLSGSFNYFKFKTDAFDYSYDYNNTTYNKNFDAVKSSSWFTRFSSKIKLPVKIDWQTNLSYRAPKKTAQSDYKSRFGLDLAFSKDFFNEKATLSFNVNDLLNSKRMKKTSYNSDRENPRSISELDFQWRPRSFTLNFTYRFNQKKKRKRSSRGYDGGEGGF